MELLFILGGLFMSHLLLQTGTSATSSYIMMGAMLVVVYLVMFMPQRKQQKRVAQMRASLDIGDEILTQGGIIGRVVNLKEDTVVIETGSDRVKLRIVRSAIAQNITPKESAGK
jgi:preprotein translocase subunit YajC